VGVLQNDPPRLYCNRSLFGGVSALAAQQSAPAADQFPEDKYGWSPTPEVRTWGGLLGHLIDDNNTACFLMAGETAAQPRLDNGGKPTDAAPLPQSKNCPCLCS